MTAQHSITYVLILVIIMLLVLNIKLVQVWTIQMLCQLLLLLFPAMPVIYKIIMWGM
uniref:Uncharacterized protein n=1 Tax=Arundo donax TaxID=35708 RepID=A0A0A9HS04_ARUDO